MKYQSQVGVKIICNTIVSVPSQAPSNISTQSYTSPHSINLTWSAIPPKALNGKLLGHKILYRKVLFSGQKFDGQLQEMLVGPSNLSARVYHLDNYAGYEFSILGFNAKGDGVVSDPVFAGKVEKYG